jgi:hypothetical protein
VPKKQDWNKPTNTQTDDSQLPPPTDIIPGRGAKRSIGGRNEMAGPEPAEERLVQSTEAWKSDLLLGPREIKLPSADAY